MSLGRWAFDVADTAARVGEGAQVAHALGRRALSGASGVYRGTRGLHGVGVQSRHQAYDERHGLSPGRVLVGGDVYHTDAELGRVLGQLDSDFGRFRSEVEPRVSAPGAPAALVQWWRVDVGPTLDEWVKFYAAESSSWVTRASTSWSTYASWWQQLRALRSAARLQGIALVSPEPSTLPETLFERGEKGRGGAFETLWTFARTIVYAAVGVVGVFSIYSVWRDVRGQIGAPKDEGRKMNE